MRQLEHPSIDEITLTDVLAALSDPVRLAIVARLGGGRELGCGEFEVPVAKSTLSHHIKVLRGAGVLDHRQDGTRCFVSLRADLERRFPGLLGSIMQLADEEIRKTERR